MLISRSHITHDHQSSTSHSGLERGKGLPNFTKKDPVLKAATFSYRLAAFAYRTMEGGQGGQDTKIPSQLIKFYIYDMPWL